MNQLEYKYLDYVIRKKYHTNVIKYVVYKDEKRCMSFKIIPENKCLLDDVVIEMNQNDVIPHIESIAKYVCDKDGIKSRYFNFIEA